MPRVFISAVVAVLVMASGCGGGDQDNARVEPSSDARVEPPSDVSTVDGAAADSTTSEALDQRERVQLGSRFEWCAATQDAWDRNDEGFATTLAAVADYNNALDALSGAVDELDRAEALEQIGALRERALELIDAYGGFSSQDDTRPRLMRGIRGVIGQLNDGAEGTEGVAYARAREAFDANASTEDSTLLREFRALDSRRIARDDNAPALRTLQLPPAVRASLGDPPELVELAYQRAPIDAGRAVESGIEESRYDYAVANAAGSEAEAEVLGRLGDVDILSPARTYARAAADYPATVKLAFESAMAASEAAAAAAVGQGGDKVLRESHSAAVDAALRVFDDAVTAIKDAASAYGQIWLEAVAAESEATGEAYPDLPPEASEAKGAAYEAARRAVADTARMVITEAQRAAEAAKDAAVAANEITLYNATHQSVAETVRAARAEGLVSAVVAEALLNEFEMGLVEVDRVDWLFAGESSFGRFMVRAVAVESLVRSDAWHAMQRSLVDACQ